ncbi:hypothetical protein [Flavilitoribacter nigricans]|uniref:Tetratricopeptide repeat protein n=1 Tax=Flavilitoribacter nigricans (strain ATCC 23147 / DSM 23189 / NBRC 102662 / NCIMB 1420 / SS-2) TaxID=1122177 RepID=A0A2D0N399_FLAN2|nr:hypothetical protein [Flavilitoribacter nigricans]PHN02233.1 hypothetical protein CRP01_33405 [Flavilitoribacter nigricans DSM 23189 = NBRC 102662]
MDKESIYYQLEDYLDDKLPAAEKEALRQRINTEDEVAEQLALLRLERELAAVMIDDELDAKMEAWASEPDLREPANENNTPPESVQDDEPKPNASRRWLSVLLVLAGIGVVFYLLMPSAPLPSEDPGTSDINGEILPSDPRDGSTETEVPGIQPVDEAEQPTSTEPMSTPSVTPPVDSEPKSTKKPDRPVAENDNTPTDRLQQLALAQAEIVSPINNTRTSRSSGDPDPDESLISKGSRLMDNGDLPGAVEIFKSIPPEQQGEYRNAQQYLGFIYFEQDSFTQAIPLFRELIEKGYYDMDKMRWYLALAELATGVTSDLGPIDELATNSGDRDVRKAAAQFLEAAKKKG